MICVTHSTLHVTVFMPYESWANPFPQTLCHEQIDPKIRQIDPKTNQSTLKLKNVEAISPCVA